ncbi:putative leucine-rich repeat domain, L domain-containing protein [Rosa chinensis]|uniref:Putative leucine-rich repeat domain, L domain-containing protein n=1 Tax=Rosa chinensis TaxID=74649 RepID=A0A2P6PKQ2_ROSCH|nr:putative leucine-rich repeat domain, L domain-containing protein [Rosa chinensis]
MDFSIMDFGHHSIKANIQYDVGYNLLQGQLPRSLKSCAMLEYLRLSNKAFTDVFHYWLGVLP